MAIRHIANLVTKNSNTYVDTASFHAEHGPLGKDNVNCTSVSFELLPDGTGVKRTVIFDNEAQRDLFFPQMDDGVKTFVSTRIEEVVI